MMNVTRFETENRRLQILLAVLGLSGIVLLFFPFAGDSSVADGWRWLGRIMLPVTLLPFLISAGYFARLAISRLPRWVNPAAYIAAIVIAGTALSDWQTDIDDLLFVALMSVVPAICMFLGIRFGTDKLSDMRGLLVLQGLYSVHLSFFLAGLIDMSHNVGYWLASLTLAVTLVQIGLQANRAKPWASLLFAPCALMWVAGLFG